MGCSCCRMIQCYIFNPVEGPSPGFTNEGNNYKDKEHGSHKQISNHELNVPKRVENKNQVSGPYHSTRNTRENVVVDGKENSPAKCVGNPNGLPYFSSEYTNVNHSTGPTNGIRDEGQTTSPRFGGDFHASSGLSQENLLQKESGLAMNANRTLASEKPESLQVKISRSIEDNNSLIERAILDKRNEIILQLKTHYLNDCYETDSLKSERAVSSNGQQSSESHSLESIESIDSNGLSHDPNLSLQAANGIGGPGEKGNITKYPKTEAINEENIDADVAEALAALAAALAEEDEMNDENGY